MGEECLIKGSKGVSGESKGAIPKFQSEGPTTEKARLKINNAKSQCSAFIIIDYIDTCIYIHIHVYIIDNL